MTAMTIDALAGGGRMIIGVGVSGPQIVEGWYGQPWGRPNARLRDYLTIVRKVLDREHPLTHDGEEISLPYTGPGATGQGKALKSILHPAGKIDVWLAAGGQRNVELCAELCDGWLPMGLSVRRHRRVSRLARTRLRQARRRPRLGHLPSVHRSQCRDHG